jgi:hypothetical protein
VELLGGGCNERGSEVARRREGPRLWRPWSAPKEDFPGAAAGLLHGGRVAVPPGGAGDEAGGMDAVGGRGDLGSSRAKSGSFLGPF